MGIQLIFATFFICVGFGISTLQIPAIFCLITGTKLKNIGIRMSWFFILSSIGRIIGPIFGFYVIKAQNGSIDFLAHISSFYLLCISFVALIIIMEAKKNNAFLPISYYQNINDEKKKNEHKAQKEPIITLHSQRKVFRVPSKSNTQSVTPYSRPKCSPKSATNHTRTNSKSDDMKEESKHNDDDEYYQGNIDKKKHFNYSPVHRTESTESIKVTYKPKKTFLEKWDLNENDIEHFEDDEVLKNDKNNTGDSKKNILQTLKSKSTRLLRKNSGENKKKNKQIIYKYSIS